MRDWATNGQCTQKENKEDKTKALAGRCGAQLAVLDLTKPSNGWPGVAGHVEFYMVTAGSSQVPDDSMFPFGMHTMYEIGSTTKAYTTTLTQILVDQGHLSWEDPISKFFPEVEFADPEVASITLHLLSTHRSGLPSRPWNLPSTSPAYELYANFTEGELIEFLRSLSYEHQGATPKGEFIYCNNGFGLIGAILERVMKKSYEDLLYQYIFDPLGLNETSVDRLTSLWEESGKVPLNASWMSPGHDKYSGEVKIRRQPYGIYKANGALKSSAHDMMRWLQAALLGFAQTPSENEGAKSLRAGRSK